LREFSFPPSFGLPPIVLGLPCQTVDRSLMTVSMATILLFSLLVQRSKLLSLPGCPSSRRQVSTLFLFSSSGRVNETSSTHSRQKKLSSPNRNLDPVPPPSGVAGPSEKCRPAHGPSSTASSFFSSFFGRILGRLSRSFQGNPFTPLAPPHLPFSSKLTPPSPVINTASASFFPGPSVGEKGFEPIAGPFPIQKRASRPFLFSPLHPPAQHEGRAPNTNLPPAHRSQLIFSPLLTLFPPMIGPSVVQVGERASSPRSIG